MLEIKIGLTEKSKKNIKRFPKEFEDSLKPTFELIMLKAEARSKQHYFKSGTSAAPVNSKFVTSRSGNLRRTISSQVRQQQNKLYAALTADVEYAATHEYGDLSRNIKQRAFLTPAIEDIIDDAGFERVLIDEIDKRTRWK